MLDEFTSDHHLEERFSGECVGIFGKVGRHGIETSIDHRSDSLG